MHLNYQHPHQTASYVGLCISNHTTTPLTSNLDASMLSPTPYLVFPSSPTSPQMTIIQHSFANNTCSHSPSHPFVNDSSMHTKHTPIFMISIYHFAKVITTHAIHSTTISSPREKHRTVHFFYQTNRFATHCFRKYTTHHYTAIPVSIKCSFTHKRHFVGPQLRADILEFVTTCPHCQIAKPRTTKPLGTILPITTTRRSLARHIHGSHYTTTQFT